MSRSCRAHIAVECLEARETPSVETFNQVVVPALPSTWSEWSNDGANVFATAAAQGIAGSIGAVSSAGSRTTGLAWSSQKVSGDTGAAALVKLDSLSPALVFARGSNLGTTAPSYVAAVITRGVNVSVVEVANGTGRVLAGLASPSSAYFSGGWVRVSLVPSGNTVAVQVIRQDTGQYLNAQGTWQ